MYKLIDPLVFRKAYGHSHLLQFYTLLYQSLRGGFGT